MIETVELIQKYRKGDTCAFELLYLKHKDHVFRNALYMICNRQEAEDVLQDVFIAAWNSRNKYDPKKAKFVTWLHKITVNRCIDKMRKEQLGALFYGGELTDLLSVDNRDLPEDILIKKLKHERLIHAISRLGYKHRSVLILRYMNELSYSDIADILEIPLGTVKSRIHNALCSLREQMSPTVLDEQKKGTNHGL